MRFRLFIENNQEQDFIKKIINDFPQSKNAALVFADYLEDDPRANTIRAIVKKDKNSFPVDIMPSVVYPDRTGVDWSTWQQFMQHKPELNDPRFRKEWESIVGETQILIGGAARRRLFANFGEPLMDVRMSTKSLTVWTIDYEPSHPSFERYDGQLTNEQLWAFMLSAITLSHH